MQFNDINNPESMDSSVKETFSEVTVSCQWEITFSVVIDRGDIKITEKDNSGNKYGIQVIHVSGASLIKGQKSHTIDFGGLPAPSFSGCTTSIKAHQI
jgi:hypothetical protein